MDDSFIKEGSKSRRIPRADVAELCVNCLLLEEARNRSVDVVAAEPGDGAPTTDFGALLAGMAADCDYSDMQAEAVVRA